MAKPRTLADLVSTGGALTTPSIVAVPGTSSGGGSVRLAEDTDNGTHYVGLRAPDAIGASIEFKLPAADGAVGQVLGTDGAGNLAWSTPRSGPTWSAPVTTSFTASVNSGYPVDTTSGPVTVTLPASPARGDVVILVDYAGTWGTNACTISPSASKIWGAASNQKIIATRGACSLVYIDSTQGWLFESGIYQFPNFFGGPPFSVEYLVQAGGGGGGASNPGGGGGGAGGQTSNINFVTSGGTSYTVTIGAGGANYANGSNSTFATITRTGGGRGANNFESNPPSGGCGGGGGGGNSYGQPGGLGNAGGYTPVEGYNGGNGGGNAQAGGSVRNGGGGGGTNGGGGWAGSSGSEGFGGAGLSSSITGTSTPRGGGGGGTGTSSVGAGGAGGGGSGGGGSGSANTGGGGGAGGGGGGSGVVIIAYPNNFADLASVGAGLVCNGSAGNTVSNLVLRPGYKVYQFTAGTGSISW